MSLQSNDTYIYAHICMHTHTHTSYMCAHIHTFMHAQIHKHTGNMHRLIIFLKEKVMQCIDQESAAYIKYQHILFWPKSSLR